MSTNTRVGSGQLFVRFVSIGLVSLFASVIFLKSTSVAGPYSAITLGIFIFIINFVAVLGYTFAVLKSPQVLAESDAPDLAYYLGFCLTVGALSATFITDTLLSQFVSINLVGKDAASAQTDLIKGSLIQFGVGLTATLIGLCAKIYLSSKQSYDLLEPEELYRNFRVEISTFEKEMRFITDSYSRTVEESASRINSSVSDACSSFDKLRDFANKSNESIAKSISQDNISKPISDFINSISSITNVTNDFSTAANYSIQGFKEISSSLETMKSSIESADLGIKSLQASAVLLSNSTQSLVKTNDDIKLSNQTLSSDITSFSSTIKSATQNTGKFFVSLKEINEHITQTGKEFSTLNDRAELGIVVASLFSERLNDLTNSLSQLGNQLTTFENLLVKNNSELKLSNESNRTFISDIENFQNVIKKITSDLFAFESRLSQTNNSN